MIRAMVRKQGSRCYSHRENVSEYLGPESLLVCRHFQTMSIACHMSRPTLICLRRYVRTYCLLSFKLISTVLLSTVKLNSGQFSFTVRRMGEVLDNPRADKTLLGICHTKRLVLSALSNGIPWG